MKSIIPSNTASFSVAEVCRITSGNADGPGDATVRGIATDTRGSIAGQLFVALSGAHFDGHAFIAQAFAKGAAAVLAARDQALERHAGTIIRVDSPLAGLGMLAHHHRLKWSGKVVAVGGSAGKTTTRSAVATVLRELRGAAVHSPAGNLNNRIGVPMVLLGLEPKHRVAVVEIGTNQPGEVALLGELARPDVALLTLIGIEHTEGLRDLEGIAREEGDLLRAVPPAGCLIVNGDDPLIQRQLETTRGARIVRVGFGVEAHYRIAERRTTAELATRFRVERPRAAALEAELSLLGVAGARAAALALAASEAIEGESLPVAVFQRACSNMAAEPGRLSAVKLGDGTLLIDDSYNANPPSMQASIELAREVATVLDRRLVLVLGSMRELGSLSSVAHAELGEVAARMRPSAVIGVGSDCAPLVEQVRHAKLPGELVESAPEALAELRTKWNPGDVVLVKGSRSIGLERVVAALVAERGAIGNRAEQAP